jgi:uncharacterized delta-60 repeat protein
VSFVFVGNDAGLSIQRRRADASLDPAFGGGDGRVEISDGGDYLAPTALAIDAQGNITIAGYRYPLGGDVNTQSSMFVAQIDANGVAVTAFGGDGIIGFDPFPASFNTPDAVLRRPDGSALVCDSGDFGGQFDVTVNRITPSGTFDAAYGSSGTLYYDSTLPAQSNRHDYCYAMASQPGTDLVHLALLSSGAQRIVRLLRIDAQGDNPIALSDLVSTPTSNYYTADLAFDAVGRALLLAPTGNEGGTLAFAIARYNADGSRDTSFGTSGVRVQPIPLPPGSNQATVRSLLAHVAVDARGRILMAGELEHTDSNLAGWVGMRLSGDVLLIDGFED